MLSAQAVRTLLDPTNPAFSQRGPLVWLSAALLAGLGSALALLLWSWRRSLLRRIQPGGPAAWLWSLWVAGAGFAFFGLAFDAPFFLSSQVFYSIGRFSTFALGVAPESQGLFSAAWANCAGWAIDSLASGLACPFVLAGLAVALVLPLVRPASASCREALAHAWLYLLPITGFLFLAVTKKNWATQAMLLPLAALVVFLACAGCSPEGTRRRGVRLLCLATCLAALGQAAWNLTAGRPSLLDWPAGRNGLAQEVTRLNEALFAKLEAPYKAIVLVNRDFPLDKTDPRVRTARYDGGPDAPIDPLLAGLAPGSILVVAEDQLSPKDNALLAPLDNLGSLTGKRFLRTGQVEPGTLFRLYGMHPSKD